MKRILLSILSIFFPWLIILIDEKPIAAVGCLALQLTFIGWLPATIWAWGVAKKLSKSSSTRKIKFPPDQQNINNGKNNSKETISNINAPVEKVQTAELSNEKQSPSHQPNVKE